MSLNNPPTSDRDLLHDLVRGFGPPGHETALTMGIMGSATHTPQPANHCLRTCLGGDPGAIHTRGCPFLIAAAHNQIDVSALRNGQCAKGFQVAAQQITVGAEQRVLMAVNGNDVPATGAAEGTDVLRHLDSASQLVQRVGQLLEENAGFADYLLQSYEQLNQIFDLVSKVAGVQDTRAIEILLLQRIARLLSAEVVGVVTLENDARWYRPDEEKENDPTTQPPFDPGAAQEVVQSVRATRQVVVSTVCDHQVLAGPLVHLDDEVHAVIAVRPPGRAPFIAGDMMATESVLAFGSQIISNNELQQRLREMSFEVTRALVAAIDKKDHYTSGHSERGGFLTRLIAGEMGLSSAEQQIMEWAGLLHDIGKIGIPEEILCKPGKLTAEEYDVIKQHPRMGYEILQPIASFELVLDGVLHHHEHPDGSGYPSGLKGDDIPLVARIIHVADTFDALTSTRSYRQAFSMSRAFEIIEEDKGTRIDPEAAEAFRRAFDAYRHDDPEDFARRFANIQENADVRS